jgi:hypothetical protein
MSRRKCRGDQRALEKIRDREDTGRYGTGRYGTDEVTPVADCWGVTPPVPEKAPSGESASVILDYSLF